MRPCSRPGCNQDAYEGKRCYYDSKLESGLLESSGSFSASEVRALLAGRLHGDGRRLDLWVIEDQVGLTKERV